MRAQKESLHFYASTPQPRQENGIYPLLKSTFQSTGHFEILLDRNCLNRYNTYRITEMCCFLWLDKCLGFFFCFLSTYSVTKNILHCFACVSYFLSAGRKKVLFSWLLPLVPSKVICKVQCLSTSEDTSAVWWSHPITKSRNTSPSLQRLRKHSLWC